MPDNGLIQICCSNVALSWILKWGREMSKIIFLIILVGLAVVAFAAININNVNASQPPEFIQVSVLAKNQADYGVDKQVMAIPAVSVEIIEDAAQDFQPQSSLRIITYTSLPTTEAKQDSEGSDGSESFDETRHNNGQGNGNGGSNPNNGNGNNGKGNSNEKDKDKHKDKDKGNKGRNGK